MEPPATPPCAPPDGGSHSSSGGLISRLRHGSSASSTNSEAAIETTSAANLPALQARIAVHPRTEFHDLADADQLIRFLKARKGHTDAAYAMWEKWAQFQTEFKPKAITYDDVKPIIEHEVLYTHEQDKEGRGVCYVALRHHQASTEATSMAIKAAVYNLEQAIALSQRNGAGAQITVFWDHSGCTLTNFDISLLIGKNGLIHILQDYYPERLAATHLIYADWIFKVLWKLVSPFIDERTRHKIHVYGHQPVELQAFFDKEQLPEEYQSIIYPPAKSEKSRGKVSSAKN